MQCLKLVAKIILVGAGNIGSRHLQGLARLPDETEIHIVEPATEAQNLARARLNEITYDKFNHNFFWYNSLNDLKTESDLTIVATTSVGRVNLINRLMEKGHSRFLIEKIVCQSQEEYNQLITKMRTFNAKGWVNTNRRYFKSYKNIVDDFQNTNVINLSVVAGYAGLGRDAIHYIDLFSWLTRNYKIKLSGEFLIEKLYPNKRGEHLVEFGGTIVGAAENSSFLSLTFVPDGNLPQIIHIVGDDKYLIVDETNNCIYNLKNGNKLDFKFEYASSLTTKIAEDIIQNDDCLLPSVEDSSYAHKELFRIFNLHLEKIKNEKVKICPIT